MKSSLKTPKILRLLSFTLLILLVSNLNSFAEGTAQQRPTSADSGLFGLWTNYPGEFRPGGTFESVNFPDFRYNIRISSDFANELIHVGATPGISEDMYFRIRDPQDNIVFGPQLLACDAAPGDPGFISSHAECQAGPNTIDPAGYTPFTLAPTMAGDYYIEFNPIDPTTPTADRNDKFIAYLDITVEKAGAAVDGRFWSKIWEMNQRETSAYSCGATDLVLDQLSNTTYTQFIYDTNDSIVTSVFHDKIDPRGNWFVISNDSGPLDTGDFTVDRQSQPNFNFANLRPQHGLFWNEPDPTEFPIGILGDIDDNSVTATGCPIEGICINVTSNKPGQVAIFVDLDGTPGYQPGTADVFLEDTISAGFNCVEWDGNDGFGTPLPEGTYDVTVQARYSPVHLPYWDMETNVPGFLLTRVNPSPMNLTIYWDDALIAGGTQELLGVPSPDHTWPVTNQGNNILYNTYWFGSVDEFIIPVDLVLTCPPVANLDTDTIPSGGTTVIDVLANDTDPEDNIDPTLVTIISGPTAGGTATVDPVTGEITYTGPAGYTGLDSILYQVTDETGFSDTAWVVVFSEAVPTADLSLTKDMTPAIADIGDAITFTVTVTNDGPDDATGVEVTDQLPASYTYVSDDSGGSYDPATGLWTIGTIANGASAVLTIEATLNDYTDANVAEVTGSDQVDPDSTPGNDDPAEDDQDSAGPPSPPDVPEADLSLIKDMTPAVADIGDAITFTVTVTNDGPDDADNVEVTDQLPASYTYVSDDAAGAYDPATGIWTIGTIANGASAVLTIEATLNDYNAANVAEVTGSDSEDPDSTPGNGDPAEDDQDEAGPPSPPDVPVSDLSLTKDMTPAIADIGDAITFTVTVTNDGPDDADNVEVTDQLPASYTYVSDDAAGAYDPATGIWTIGTIANGASAVLTIEATLVDYNEGNVAEVTGSDSDDPDSTPGNDDPTEDDQDEAGPPSPPALVSDLSLTKDMTPAVAAVGDIVTFTVTVTNDGPDDATGVEVTDQLPASYTYVSDDAAGTYDPATGLWIIGTIANGASAVLTIEATLNDYNEGNVAEITGSDNDDPDSTPGNDDPTEDDQDEAGPPMMPTPVSDLSLTKDMSPTIANIGDMITFTVTVDNAGPDAADNVEVTDQLPASFSYVSDDSGGSYDPATGVWTVGTVPAGGSAVLVIMTTLNDYTAGNVAEITGSDSEDPDSTPGNDDPTEDDQDETDPPSPPVSDLSLSKVMSPTIANIGDVITFTVTVDNAGPQDANNVEVTDQLPASFSYISDNAGGDYDPATGIWTVGTVAAGSSEVLIIMVALNDYNSGNVAEVTGSDSDDPDSTPGNGDPTEDDQDQTDPPSPPVSDLSLAKDFSPAIANIGDIITFTITVDNAGPQDAGNVEVTDQLPASYSYISDDSGGTYDPASGLWTIGTIASGGSAVLNVMAALNDYNEGNVAEITASDSEDPDSTPGNGDPDEDDQDQTDPPAQPVSDLSLTKTMNPTQLNAGEMSTFTIVVENAGPQDAQNVVVTDQLTSSYTYLADNSGGAYDPITGQWAVGTVVAGGSVSLEIMVTVNDFESGNIASITGSDSTDPDSDPNSPDPNEDDTDETDPPTPLPTDISLTKVINPTALNLGDMATFTLTVVNDGPGIATGIVVTDDMPADYVYMSSMGDGTYDPVSGDWVVPTLGPGESAELFIMVQVVAFENGNVAQVTASDQPDPDSTPDNDDPNEDDYSESDPPRRLTADLELTKTVSPAAVHINNPATFTITVTNNGPDDAVNVVVMEDLPSGLIYVSDTGAGAYDVTTGLWTIGGLSNGATATIDITVIVVDFLNAMNFAEVNDSETFDPDSSPDTGNMGEDDEDTAEPLPQNDPPYGPDTLITCVAPMVPIEICLPLMDPDGDNVTIVDIEHTFECNIVTLNDSCFVFTAFPGSEGIQEVIVFFCDDAYPVLCDSLIVEVDVNCYAPTGFVDYASFSLDGVVVNGTMVSTSYDQAIVDVLANDTDPCDYDLELAAIAENGENGIAQIVNGEIVYTPFIDFTVGMDTVDYVLCNECGACDTTQLIIDIDICITEATYVCAEPLTPIIICPDFCLDGTDVGVVEVDNIFNCIIDILDEDCVEYVPLPGIPFGSVDSLLIISCNSLGDCDTAQVFISIEEDCPGDVEAFNDSDTTEINTAVNIDVLVNDDGEYLEITTVCDPVNGSATVFNGEIIYLPDTDYVGTDSFCYVICNTTNLLCDTAMVYVTIFDPCTAAPATISADGNTVCLGAGDIITVTVDDPGVGDLSYVITDLTGTTILGGPTTDNEFSFDAAPPGTCLIWAVTSQGALDIPSDQVADISGCFELSNPLDVTRLDPEPAVITADDNFICIGTGEEVTVNITDGGTGTLVFLVTDSTGTTILGGPTTDNVFNFDGAPEGTCAIWAITYEGDIDIPTDQVADVMGCFALSNPLYVTRENCCLVDPSIISADDSEICLGDGEIVTVTVDSLGSGTLTYIVTDETATTILGGPTMDNTFTFDSAPAGTCLIWAINYTDSLVIGSDQVADIEGCFTLSNALPVIREVCCDAEAATLSASTEDICLFTDEIVTVTVDDPGVGDLAYVVTDPAGEIILSGPTTDPNFTFDNENPGSYVIWAVTYVDSLSIPSDQVADITGCFALSNPLPVVVAECDELCEIVIPSGFSPNNDGINDLFEVQGLLDPVCNCTDIKYQVFNRWGNLLYETTDPASDGWWDGMFEGEEVPDGTYFYCIICEDGDRIYDGFIEVQR